MSPKHLVILSLLSVATVALAKIGSKIRFLRPLRFTHSRVVVTDATLNSARSEKKVLLAKLVAAFRDIGVRHYFISDGNLLEYHRNQPIIQDDDIDVRVSDQDFDLWKLYCDSVLEGKRGGVDVAHKDSCRI